MSVQQKDGSLGSPRCHTQSSRQGAMSLRGMAKVLFREPRVKDYLLSPGGLLIYKEPAGQLPEAAGPFGKQAGIPQKCRLTEHGQRFLS